MTRAFFMRALPACACGLLVACQSAPPDCVPTSPAPAALSHQAATVQATSQQLWHNGALNQTAWKTPGAITANSQRLTLDWDGDAVELLVQLARQRGLTFAYSGVRLPLPVSVHVRGVTFEQLLAELTTQFGWRATLRQQPFELHLYFSLPDKGGRQT